MARVLFILSLMGVMSSAQARIGSCEDMAVNMRSGLRTLLNYKKPSRWETPHVSSKYSAKGGLLAHTDAACHPILSNATFVQDNVKKIGGETIEPQDIPSQGNNKFLAGVASIQPYQVSSGLFACKPLVITCADGKKTLLDYKKPSNGDLDVTAKYSDPKGTGNSSILKHPQGGNCHPMVKNANFTFSNAEAMCGGIDKIMSLDVYNQ